MPAIRHRRAIVSTPWVQERVPLGAFIDQTKWQEEALCREVGVELFFSEEAGANTVPAAKQTCRSCPVMTECLEWALAFDAYADQHGVFGGTTPRERRELRRERHLALEVAA